MKKEKLLLIDGHNLLFQMFYGMPEKIQNKDGVYIQGVIGFFSALHKIVGMVCPDRMAVFFDSEENGNRCDILPDYKANRPDWSTVAEEDCPFTQLPYIYRALTEEGISYREIHGCEVDDVMASYASQCGDDFDIVLSSWDSDYFQLVSENVSVLRYRGWDSTVCDERYVTERYGVPASLYADYKSIVGDSADNIKGAPKVGPKTAAALIRQFGCLEEILSSADRIERELIRNAINGSAEQLRTNYRAIKLSGDTPLPILPTDMRVPERLYQTGELLRKIGL